MANKNSNSAGFTLVELMIVVAIIGILAAVATPAYYNYVKGVRQDGAKQNLLDVKSAQEMYYSMYDTYATSITASNFQGLLNFDPTDTTYYVYAMPAGSSTSYTATTKGNEDADCWEITPDASEAVSSANCP